MVNKGKPHHSFVYTLYNLSVCNNLKGTSLTKVENLKDANQ
jgi:hypothetical protein